MATIAHLEDLLANPRKVLGLVKEHLTALQEKFGDERRTHIHPDQAEELSDRRSGDGRRSAHCADRSAVHQACRVEGLSGAEARRARRHWHADARRRCGRYDLCHAHAASHSVLLGQGKVYHVRTFEVPEADRAARGVPLVNLINLAENENITAALAVREFTPNSFVPCARPWRIKRVNMTEFERCAQRHHRHVAWSRANAGWVHATHGRRM